MSIARRNRAILTTICLLDPGQSPVIREFNQENVTELWHQFAAHIRDTKGGLSASWGRYCR
jgi:hypothetical protein